MPLYRTQLVQPYFTNIPADVAVNTVYFTSTNALGDAGDMTAIKTVCNQAMGNLEPYRAANLKTTGGLTVKIYDADAPPNSSPISVGGPYNLSAPSTLTNLPFECAVVASFQADAIPGTPQARRRGRNYLGPLNTSALDDGDATTFPSVAAGMITAATSYMDDLFNVFAHSAEVRWVVYSPTNNDYALVTNGWVDNEFDTQRRRGVESTARTTITF